MSQKGIWTLEREQWLKDNIGLSMEDKRVFLDLSVDAINRKIRLLGLRFDNKTKHQSKISPEQMRYLEENYNKISRQEMAQQLNITKDCLYRLIYRFSKKKRLQISSLDAQSRFIVDHYYSMTTEQIAKCLGINRSVVRNRLGVLPINREIVICSQCGKEVIKGSNRQIYCPECREEKNNKKTNEWGHQHPDKRCEHFQKHYKQHREKVLQRSYDFYDKFKEKMECPINF